MKTYRIKADAQGEIRIDAESAEAAAEEFREQFGEAGALVTPDHSQLMVVSAVVWEDPVEVIDKDEEDIEVEGEDGEEV